MTRYRVSINDPPTEYVFDANSPDEAEEDARRFFCEDADDISLTIEEVPNER